MKPFNTFYILPAAVEEFRQARKWYASRQVKGLSNRFAQAVKNTILQILENPALLRSVTRMLELHIQPIFLMPFIFLLKTKPLLLPQLFTIGGIPQ
jgi:hypothetical protein